MSDTGREDPSQTHLRRLTLTRDQMSDRCGCMAKVSGGDLTDLLGVALGDRHHLSGGTAGDRQEDAAVVDIDAPRLLTTLDFGPLVCPGLFTAGRIAALHAMSDLFVRGGRPRWALPILIGRLGAAPEELQAVLAGMSDACRQEDVTIVGGHTSLGPEAVAGLSVLGTPAAKLLPMKPSARVGDTLLLSKLLGTGIVVRAYKAGFASDAALAEAVAVMDTSNRPAAGAVLTTAASGMTDVTGFGLLGHLAELLGDHCGAELDLSAIPVLKSVADMPNRAGATVWTRDNLDYVRQAHTMVNQPAAEGLAPLVDPQTNGGILAAVPTHAVSSLVAAGFHRIGQVTADTAIRFF